MSERCSIAGCDNDARKRGMCGMHYLRWWKHGDALHLPLASYRRPVRDRLMLNATRLRSGCLMFNGGRCGSYRMLQVGNRVKLAHRESYERNIGPIPDGMQVLHRCDNPPCIEPSHLFLGTQSDNIRDMISKGRKVTLRGERSLFSKLTVAQVQQIRASAASQRALAARFKVSQSCISAIKRGKTWL